MNSMDCEGRGEDQSGREVLSGCNRTMEATRRRDPILRYEIWAPPTWLSLLVTAFNFPNKASLKEQRLAYWEWLESLGDVIPCCEYRRLYKQCLDGMNVSRCISNRFEFSNACFRIVQIMDSGGVGDNAPCFSSTLSSSYEECRYLIEGMRAKCPSADKQQVSAAGQGSNGKTNVVARAHNKIRKPERGCIVSEYGKRGKCTINVSNVEQPAFTISRDCRPERTLTNEQYDSGDGFQTNEWGPVFWRMIHLLSYCYATDSGEAMKDLQDFRQGLTRKVDPSGQQAQAFKRWIAAIGNILPCVYCRNNYQDRLEETGLYQEDNDIYSSRVGVVNFCIRLHNAVNDSTSPRKPSWNYNAVHKTYEPLFTTRTNTPYKTCISIVPL